MIYYFLLNTDFGGKSNLQRVFGFSGPLNLPALWQAIYQTWESQRCQLF